jgi:hypothetical protein
MPPLSSSSFTSHSRFPLIYFAVALIPQLFTSNSSLSHHFHSTFTFRPPYPASPIHQRTRPLRITMQSPVADAVNGDTSPPASKQSTTCLIPTTTTQTYQVDTTLHITNDDPASNSEIYVPRGSQVSAFVSLGGPPLDGRLSAAATGTCHQGQNWTHGWNTEGGTLLKIKTDPHDQEKRDKGPSYWIPPGATIREYPGIPSLQHSPSSNRQSVPLPEALNHPENDGSRVNEQAENGDTCVDPTVATAPTVQTSRVFPGARYDSCKYWIGENDCLDYPNEGNITHRGERCNTGGEIEIGMVNGQPSASAFMYRRGGRQQITRGRTTFIPIPQDEERVKLVHLQQSCSGYSRRGIKPYTATHTLITPPVLKTEISEWLGHQKSVAAERLSAAR